MIRPATIQDAPQLASVHVASWHETYTGLLPDSYIADYSYEKRLGLWERILARENTAVVYEDAGHIVGFSHGGPLFEPLPSYRGELYSLYLLKSHHGRGIGRELFEITRQSLADAQLHPFATWVLDTNPALDFYRKSGARVIGERYEKIDGTEVRDLQLGWN